MKWFRCLLLQASMHDTCDLTADRPWELFVVLDTPPSMVNKIKSVKDGDPDKDLVIGIATFANNSSWDDGERCGIVFISSIRDWIEDIVSLEVIPPYEISQIILSTRGFMELKNDLSILEELQSPSPIVIFVIFVRWVTDCCFHSNGTRLQLAGALVPFKICTVSRHNNFCRMELNLRTRVKQTICAIKDDWMSTKCARDCPPFTLTFQKRLLCTKDIKVPAC